MEPIVNPVFIYLIETLGNIHCIALVVALVSLVVTLVFAWLYATTEQGNQYEFIAGGDESDFAKLAIRVNNRGVDLVKDLEIVRKILKKHKYGDKEFDDKFDDTLRSLILDLPDQIQNNSNKIRIVYEDFLKYQKEMIDLKKNLKISVIVTIVAFFLVAVLPSTTTGYRILSASLITSDNINMSVDVSKEYIDWAIKSFVNAVQNIQR